jgi:hypothetical protein
VLQGKGLLPGGGGLGDGQGGKGGQRS